MGEVHQWANIHPDLLNEIANQFYSHDDYIRLRLVCKEWNLRLPSIPNHNRNPWLVLPGVDETFETHSLEKKEINHLILTEMQDNFIRGSCYGWLISVMISDGTIRMLNPFTKTHFDLPPISTLPEVLAYRPNDLGNEYTFLHLPDDRICKLDRIHMHKCEVWKVVTSSPPTNDNDDFMAVAIYGDGCRLAFYKLNDKRWTDIPTAEDHPNFQDVIFLQEKIYAVDERGRIYEFDAKTKPLPMGGINEVAPPPCFPNGCVTLTYLIGCDDGSLLMLVRHFDERQYGFQSYKFDIFTLNKDAKEWSKIHSLGDYVLIIGYNPSVRTLAHTFPNGKGNHVYYTDNLMELHSIDSGSYQDIGILNLEDNTIQKILSNTDFLCPPVWLLP